MLSRESKLRVPTTEDGEFLRARSKPDWTVSRMGQILKFFECLFHQISPASKTMSSASFQFDIRRNRFRKFCIQCRHTPQSQDGPKRTLVGQKGHLINANLGGNSRQLHLIFFRSDTMRQNPQSFACLLDHDYSNQKQIYSYSITFYNDEPF